MQKLPRLVIGACQGRSGKTTFTLGLLQALKKRGIKVQPFKKGPDYIDPSWLTYAAGVQCRNLDAFMMDREVLVDNFISNAKGKEISIIEGAMGLFDGLDLEGSGSTAEIAYLIKAPVILVVNCQRMTRSVAALVNGVVNFDQRIKIAGVVLNNVARTRHRNMLKDSIEKYCQVPVVGSIPKSKEIMIPDRHLGLVPANEQEELISAVGKLGDLIAENVDLDKLLTLANEAQGLKENWQKDSGRESSQKVRIGVLRDKVFSFYYPENLEALSQKGAQLVWINSLEDKTLPPVDALYIGGGFPEMFAEELEKNQSLRLEIKKAALEGLPIYAECGGLMYLSRKICWENKCNEMVGVFPCDISMEKKPQGHGYTINEIVEDNPFLPLGLKIKGHEFHNSRVINFDGGNAIRYGTKVLRGKGITGQADGIICRNVFASYNHLHAASVPQWAEGFVRAALSYKDGGKNN